MRKQSAQRFTAAGLMILMAVGARAQDLDAAPPARTQSQPLDQLIYRGIVGNMLETVPLDPDKRVELQRANAVVSNTFSGRTLAILLGFTTPVFMIGGLAWGVFAASRIKPAAQAQAASVAGAGVCGAEWLASVEAAASGPALESPPARPRDEIASIQN